MSAQDLSAWAAALTVFDPTPQAAELLGVDADAVSRTFRDASRSCVTLWRGLHQVSEAQRSLVQGWSASEPARAVGRVLEAAGDARAVVLDQVSAADLTASRIRQIQVEVNRVMAGVEAQIGHAQYELGGAAEVAMAAIRSLGPVTAIELRPVFLQYQRDIDALQSRLDGVLGDFVTALRADPSDAVVNLRSGPGSSAVPPSFAEQNAHARADAAMQRLSADLASADPTTRHMALGVQDALRVAAEGGAPVSLTLYESAHGSTPGRTAITVGDAATSENNILIATGLRSSAGDFSGTARQGARLQQTAQALGGGSTAVTIWLGYDAPWSAQGDGLSGPGALAAGVQDGTDALDDDAARVGADHLLNDLETLGDQMRPDTHLTVVAHSYATLVASLAAQRGAAIDDLVLLASPGAGAGVHSTQDYPAVPEGHTYTLNYPWDPVPSAVVDAGVRSTQVWPPLLGSLGTPYGGDPSSPGFGSRQIDTPSNSDGLLLAQHDLENYLSGASGLAVAAIGVGQYARAPVWLPPVYPPREK